jgi:hypothetical protein
MLIAIPVADEHAGGILADPLDRDASNLGADLAGVKRPLDDSGKQTRLRSEEVNDQRRVNTGVASDPAQRGSGVAVAGKGEAGDLEDRLA